MNEATKSGGQVSENGKAKPNSGPLPTNQKSPLRQRAKELVNKAFRSNERYLVVSYLFDNCLSNSGLLINRYSTRLYIHTGSIKPLISLTAVGYPGLGSMRRGPKIVIGRKSHSDWGSQPILPSFNK